MTIEEIEQAVLKGSMTAEQAFIEMMYGREDYIENIFNNAISAVRECENLNGRVMNDEIRQAVRQSKIKANGKAKWNDSTDTWVDLFVNELHERGLMITTIEDPITLQFKQHKENLSK